MKLSIIIPAYNAAPYIERCLESVLDQDFDDYEVIVINDGSTDNTLELLQNFKGGGRKRRIIRILTQENQGVSAARNRGIEEAKGEWVMFVDADDTVERNSLKPVFESLALSGAEDADLVMLGMSSYSRAGVYDEISKFDFKVWDDPKRLFARLSTLSMCSPCGKLYNRNKLIFGNIRFDTSMKLYEDGIFNFKYAELSEKVVTLPGRVYYYYKNFGSSTNKFYGESLVVWNEYLRAARSKFYQKICDNEADKERMVVREIAFCYLFGIYSIYRSRQRVKNKGYWLKTYWSAADEHDLRWSYQLDSGIPKTVGIIGRRSKRLLDWWLRIIFMAERVWRILRK